MINIETLKADLKTMAIHEIARVIQSDWKKVYFGAVPYLGAMHCLNTVNDEYGMDSGKSIVIYFLGNAQTYRGEIAKLVKNELKGRTK